MTTQLGPTTTSPADDVAVPASTVADRHRRPVAVRLLGRPGAARLLSVLTVILVWQLAQPVLETELIPSPARVAEFMWAEIRADTVAPDTLYASFAITLGRLAAGLGLALVIGVPIGLAMGFSWRIDTALSHFVVVGLSVPSLVYAIVTAMVFGFGSTGPILTAMLASIAFIILSTAEGVRNVPKDLLKMAAAYRVPTLRRIRQVVLPGVLPFLFAAIRFGLASGWRGLVVAEIFAASSGAGWMVKFWFDAHRTYGVLGYAIFFLLFALLIERLVFGSLGARLFRWRPQIQQSGRSR
ncbi:MAG: ABC transporter permease [Acidimicrobiales bacterium]